MMAIMKNHHRRRPMTRVLKWINEQRGKHHIIVLFMLCQQLFLLPEKF